MKIERFEDLIDWTRQTHQFLADCTGHCAGEQKDTLASWLLAYLSDHEKALASTIGKIEKHADGKALHTWIYDYLVHNKVELHSRCSGKYAEMGVDEIAADIFDIHNQILDLYRSLERRADTDKARDLLAELLALEEHETMRMAQQVNRLHEL